MFTFDPRRAPSFEAGPKANAPVYRSRGDASDQPAPRRRTDREACLTFALVALGCAPGAVFGLARGEAISAEVTICMFLLVASVALLLRELAPLGRARSPRRGEGFASAPGHLGQQG